MDAARRASCFSPDITHDGREMNKLIYIKKVKKYARINKQIKGITFTRAFLPLSVIPHETHDSRNAIGGRGPVDRGGGWGEIGTALKIAVSLSGEDKMRTAAGGTGTGAPTSFAKSLRSLVKA